MKIYWSLRQIPELSNLSDSELNKRWHRAYWYTFRHWQTWAGFLAIALCGPIGNYIGSSFGHPIIGGGIGGGIGGFIYLQVAINVAFRYYQHILLGHENI